MNTIRKLVLFDIDGTLVLTGGAGIRAMNRACEELVGHHDALDGIPVAGRTDRIILTRCGRARPGTRSDDGLLEQLRERYIANLREEIERPGRRGESGARRRRDARAFVSCSTCSNGADDVFLGLLTGNFEAGARIKLEHFDLWRYFRAARSGTMPRIGMSWCRSRSSARAGAGCRHHPAGHILVVGDTPHDVACARAVGAVPVGVATGGSRRAAARAAERISSSKSRCDGGVPEAVD